MSLITAEKNLRKVRDRPHRIGGGPTAVLGCSRCGKVSHTGAEDEVHEMRAKLRGAQ